MSTNHRGAALRLILFTCLLLVSVLAPRPAAAQNASINGFVSDNLGNPVSAATVRAITGPSAGRQTSTGSNGQYQLTNLVPGSYTFSAIKTGFQTSTRSATLLNADFQRIDFTLTSTTPTGGSITGTVTRRDTGGALSGATVTLTGGAGTTTQTATTGSNGVYRFDNLDRGSYRVAVDRDGFTSLTKSVTVTVGRVSTANFSLAIRNSELSTLQGRVTDESGIGIRGATVRLTGGSSTLSATTSSAGQYKIQKIVPDSYTVQVTASGFQGQNIPFTITAGDNARLDVNLTAVGPANSTIQGFTVDENGNAVAGARVTITAGNAPGSAVSDSTGAYVISGLPAGTYVLKATATGFASDTETTQVAQDGTARQDFTLVSNPNQQVGTITGQVTSSSGGGALSGVLVSVTSGPNEGETTATDSLGNYSLSDLSPGTYSLQFSRNGFTTRTVSAIHVAARQTITQNVVLTPGGTGGGSLSGTVADSSTGEVLSGVSVRLSLNGGVVDTATTDSSGQYSFAALTAGTYSVRFSKSGYTVQTLNANVGSSGTTTLDVDLIPSSGGSGTSTIKGVVRDSAGHELQGITVNLSTGDSVQTNEDGQFSFTGLQAGTYTVTASGAGLVTVSQSVTVADGATASVSLSMTSDGSAGILTGTVHAANGQAIPAAITLVRGPVTGITHNASSSGRFTFTGLPTGAYTLEVRSPGYSTRQVNVFVRQGSTSSVSVFLGR